MTDIKITLKDGARAPSYQTEGTAGADVSAFLVDDYVLSPGEWAGIPTGIFMAIPEGYEVQVRPRSGLAFRNGITVLNAPGTIDSDYRGEVKVILINHSKVPFTIHNGDRIAQLVVQKVERSSFTKVAALDETERQSGGFGSTGV